MSKVADLYLKAEDQLKRELKRKPTWSEIESRVKEIMRKLKRRVR